MSRIIYIILFPLLFVANGWTGNLSFHSFHRDMLTASADSTEKKPDRSTVLINKPLKSPLRAMVQSAVVPGWGQWYCGKKWKAGIVLAGESYLLYQVIHLNNVYNDKRRLSDAGLPAPGKKRALQRRKDFTWILAVTHVFTVLDAVTEAYLFKFDDLMKDKAGVTVWQKDQTIGLSLAFSF